MTDQLDVTLSGASLSALDERIRVTDVLEHPVNRMKSAVRADAGRCILLNERERLDVTVKCVVDETNPGARRSVITKIMTWAKDGGMLQSDHRIDQQLAVICTSLPDASVLRRMDEVAITFSTTLCPYWEDVSGLSVSVNGSATLSVPGNAPLTPVNMSLINMGETAITRASVTCGTSTMTFEGMNIPANGPLMLRMRNGVFEAATRGGSLLKYRTADSSDLLMVPCGQDAVVTASTDAQSLYCSATVKGRWL